MPSYCTEMKIHFSFTTIYDICHINQTKNPNKTRIPYATQKTLTLGFCDLRQEERSEGNN